MPSTMLDRLCLGTAQFGLNYGIANRHGKLTYNEISAIVKTAQEHGLRYFDTAQSYGDSEVQLGKAFREHAFSPRVISKISPEFSCQGAASVVATIKASCSRLGLASLHGFLLHRLEPLSTDRAFLVGIAEAKAQGLLENFGVSVYTPEEALTYLEHPAVDMLQVPCNIFDRRLLDQHFFTRAEQCEKQIFIRSIYLQGLIHLEEDELTAKGLARALPIMDLLKRFLGFYGLSKKTFAAHALLEEFPQAILIVGVDSLAQCLDNLAIFRAERIPAETIAAWWGSLPAVAENIVDCRKWH